MQVHVVFCVVVDRIRLSEPQSPGTAWFLDQLISASTVTKLLFELLSDSNIVSSCMSLASFLRHMIKILLYVIC